MRRLRAFGRLFANVTGLKCYWRGRCAPTRKALGMRCAACGKPGTEFGHFGFGLYAGYVAPTRLVYSRDKAELTRTDAWEPSRKGW